MDKAKIKKAFSTLGNGILLAGTAVHNGPIRSRIYEIEEEIETLLAEKAELEEQLLSN